MPTNRSPDSTDGSGASGIRLRKILVPVDFSESARKALSYGLSFATQYKAVLTLMHVIEPPIYPTELGYLPIEMESVNKTLLETAEEKMRKLTAAVTGVETEIVVRLGHPYQEITEVAREIRSDLIVISTHGYTGLKHVLLGSTAERIVRHAPCPVLTVREKELDFIEKK